MAKKNVATAKSLVGLVNDLNNNQLLALTDSANRRALKKFLNGLHALVQFVVNCHFNHNSSEVKFSGFYGGFDDWFLGKIEELMAVELPKHHHDLTRDSLDAEILADLGGKEAAEVTLAGVYELLKLQPSGESGALLTNGHANIFYVRDAEGVLHAVSVDWYVDGWDVDAYRVDDEYRWGAGGRVFSRNS